MILHAPLLATMLAVGKREEPPRPLGIRGTECSGTDRVEFRQNFTLQFTWICKIHFDLSRQLLYKYNTYSAHRRTRNLLSNRTGFRSLGNRHRWTAGTGLSRNCRTISETNLCMAQLLLAAYMPLKIKEVGRSINYYQMYMHIRGMQDLMHSVLVLNLLSFPLHPPQMNSWHCWTLLL